MAGVPGCKSTEGLGRSGAGPVPGIPPGLGRQAAPNVADRRIGRGFSLVELLVVVAIVAILAAVAYPSYQEQVRSGRRSEAQSDLMRLAQFMERLYTENGCYNPDEDCSADTAGSPTIAASADHYTVSFAAGPTANAFTLQATPTGPQAGDGILQINELGQRWWDEDRDGTLEAGEDNWHRN